jgi:Holliday junction resolvase
MASTPEGKVKARLKRELEARGVYFVMPVAGLYGRAGIPDVLCCVRGRFIGLECKATDKEKPTKIQVYEMGKIEKSGGETFVVDPTTMADVLGYIDAVRGEHG